MFSLNIGMTSVSRYFCQQAARVNVASRLGFLNVSYPFLQKHLRLLGETCSSHPLFSPHTPKCF